MSLQPASRAPLHLEAEPFDAQFRPSECSVLIADDEPRFLQSLRELIAPAGYRAATACSGAEALARIAERDWDLILLDLHFPDRAGFEVMEHVRARDLDTCVIVISGDSSADAAIGALRRGAVDFLRKPFRRDELLRTMENALRRQHLSRLGAEITARLTQSERLYRFLVDNSPDIIYTLDREGRFTFVSDSVERLLGLRKEDLLSRHYSELLHDDDLDRALYTFNERRTGKRASRNIELRLKRKSRKEEFRSFENRTVTIVLNSMGMYDTGSPGDPGDFVGTYGVARDITERKKAEEVISYQAYHDLLTDLPNRTLFKDRLGVAMAQAHRNRGLLAIMFMDLDRFKIVNDTLGHMKGDELLQKAADRLKGCLRKGDTLARVGGDEFILLLPHISGREDAATAAQKVLETLKKPFRIADNEIQISASIGIAVYPDDGESIEDLIKHADIAMYHVKWSDKNNYQFFSTPMNAVFSQKLSLEGELRRALDRGEFSVHYQPRVSVAARRVIGVEALLRWNHSARGEIPPAEFIPLAEETGVMPALGAWAMEAAFQQWAAWRAAGHEELRLAFNLSSQELEQERYVERLTALLRQHNLTPAGLDLEISENVLVRNIDSVGHKLGRLGELGARVTIDDFGTRYSSLNHMKKAPVHGLKVDQIFVQEINTRDADVSLVTALIGMARGLGVTVSAEGIETRHQVEVLQALGCDEMQGFLFARPMPAAEVAAMLADPAKLFA